MKIATVGLDLTKNVFQVHGIDAAGTVIGCKALRRRQVIPFFVKLEPCLIGIEACGTSHHWARELAGLGHRVKLIPLAYVKRGKTAASDAEAICEAVSLASQQTIGTLGVKTYNPVAQQDLAAHAANCRRLGAAATVVNRRKRQKTARLIRVLGCTSRRRAALS